MKGEPPLFAFAFVFVFVFAIAFAFTIFFRYDDCLT